MNRDAKNLLADVMAEDAPADFLETLLGGTLRAARRRRRRRQSLRALPVFIALGGVMAISLHRAPTPRRGTPEIVVVEPAYQLVQTAPLTANEIATTRAAAFHELSTLPAAIEVVQTTAVSGGFFPIGDDELLGIVKDRPALLVRMDAHSELLVFLDPNDEEGFPVN